MHIIDNNAPTLGGINPRTNQPLVSVPVTSDTQNTEAWSALREAQPAFAALSVEERVAKLQSVFTRLMRHAPMLCEAISNETGQDPMELWEHEILPMQKRVQAWLKIATRVLMPKAKGSGASRRVPYGLVLLLTPKDETIATPLEALFPALLAGNAVMWKASKHAPRSAQIIAREFHGELPNLLRIATGDHHRGSRLIEREPDHVAFYGNAQSGREVALMCTDRFVHHQLNLVGKDAALVLADADIVQSASGIASGAFGLSGRRRDAIERVFVERSIADHFISALKEATMHAPVGYLSHSRHRDRLLRFIEDAVEGGAVTLVGGEVEGNHGLRATLVVGVDQDAALMTHVARGPVLAVSIVDDANTAVEQANRSIFGLCASLWTRDIHEGCRLAARVQAGLVSLNGHGRATADQDADWEGMKHSRSGGYGSVVSLLCWTRLMYQTPHPDRGFESGVET